MRMPGADRFHLAVKYEMLRSKGWPEKVMDEKDRLCWLCLRPLATLVQWHHLVPKAKKGRDTVPLHPICHKTIHANFTNSELAGIGHDRDALLRNAQLGRFIRWIADKPSDFNARVRKKR